MGRINSGPEEVFQKIPDCHVILTGLHCGLGSPAPASSNVMTKDGKAVNNPALVMSEEPGLSEGRAGSGLVESRAPAGTRNKITERLHPDQTFSLKPLCAHSLTCLMV